MKEKQPRLILATSPFLKAEEDTSYIMWRVVYALAPTAAGAIYFFGLSAVLVIAASLSGALLSEWFFNVRPGGNNTLRDGSAVITGLLLALTLPPGLPLWMAFMGGVISIVLGKLLFGGLGFNPFNPALVGRAFLQAAFPVALTTWSEPSNPAGFFKLHGDNFAWPFLKAVHVSAVSSATPLAKMKFGTHLAEMMTPLPNLLLGSTSGSLGETGAVLILIGGLYLVVKKIVNWRIPVGILGTVFLFALVLYFTKPDKYPDPIFYLFSGGLMLGAVFMATDMVTYPITQRGTWLFAIGTGFLVMLIRIYGGLAEGVMYAILLMNAVTPLLSDMTRPRVFGEQKKNLRDRIKALRSGE